MRKIVVLVLIVFFVVGCEKKEDIMVNKITPKEVYNSINTGKYVIVDVREKNEYNEGHISNAINVSVDSISDAMEKIVVNKNINIVVYCRSGSRSLEATKKLVQLGYTNVYDMGGILNWEYDLVK